MGGVAVVEAAAAPAEELLPMKSRRHPTRRVFRAVESALLLGGWSLQLLRQLSLLVYVTAYFFRDL